MNTMPAIREGGAPVRGGSPFPSLAESAVISSSPAEQEAAHARAIVLTCYLYVLPIELSCQLCQTE